MKIHLPSIVSCLAPLAIVVVIGVATPSFAMPQMGGRGDALRQQLGKLHDSLKLNEKQEALWQQAQSASRDGMQARRAARRQAIDEMKASLDDPQADLRAIFAKMDVRRASAEKASLKIREQWLALYDSLDANQRALARGFLRARIERFEQGADRMRRGGQEPGAQREPGMQQ